MRILFFSLVMIYVNSCIAQPFINSPVKFTPDTLEEIEYYLKNWNLKGKIKSIEISEFEPKWGSYELKENKYKNLEDVPLEETGSYKKYDFRENGTISRYLSGRIHFADDRGQKLETDTTSWASGYSSYFFNTANELTLIKRGDDYTKFYYENNRRIKVVEGSETDKSVNHIRMEIKFEYSDLKKTEYKKAPRFDTLYKLDKEHFFNSKGQLQKLYLHGLIDQYILYSYDNQGRITAKEYHNFAFIPILHNDTLIYSDTIRYNSQNLVSEFVECHISRRGHDRFIKRVYKYNSDNLLSQELEYDYFKEKDSVNSKPIEWKLNMDHEVKYNRYDFNNNPTEIYNIYTMYHGSSKYHGSSIQGPELVRIQKVRYTYY